MRGFWGGGGAPASFAAGHRIWHKEEAWQMAWKMLSGYYWGPLLPEAFIQGFIQSKPSTNLASFDTGSEHYDSPVQ